MATSGELLEVGRATDSHGRSGSGWYRTRQQILDYFAGLEIVEPGNARTRGWWPAGPRTPRALQGPCCRWSFVHRRPPV
ncbi:SAM-dependent methyltransferase [Nocardia amamiensis]|uniref:SAM-dependent methyltransferase n=1 Tax=Nocardia amamiensis TaxID=404578 RepID=A0ABS0CL00_9NOCA|nr:SAM-dependent methyltransferase [Nocardia amamiensis]